MSKKVDTLQGIIKETSTEGTKVSLYKGSKFVQSRFFDTDFLTSAGLNQPGTDIDLVTTTRVRRDQITAAISISDYMQPPVRKSRMVKVSEQKLFGACSPTGDGTLEILLVDEKGVEQDPQLIDEKHWVEAGFSPKGFVELTVTKSARRGEAVVKCEWKNLGETQPEILTQRARQIVAEVDALLTPEAMELIGKKFGTGQAHSR